MKFRHTIFGSILAIFVTGAVQAETFEFAYYDPNTGLNWSRELPGLFSNGCKGSDGNFLAQNCSSTIKEDKDSDALAECRKRGARLPTVEEFKSLFRNFEVYTGDLLLQNDKALQARIAENIDRISEVFGSRLDNNFGYTTSTINTDFAPTANWDGVKIGQFGLAHVVGLAGKQYTYAMGMSDYSFPRAPIGYTTGVRKVLCVKELVVSSLVPYGKSL